VDPKTWTGRTKSAVVLCGTAGFFAVCYLLCRSAHHVGAAGAAGAALYTVLFAALVMSMLRDD
jgi:hypothetical protein